MVRDLPIHVYYARWGSLALSHIATTSILLDTPVRVSTEPPPKPLTTSPTRVGCVSNLGITATSQAFNAHGEFVGVVGVDYYLSAIEETVYTISDTGTILFIMEEDSGALVAASISGVSVNEAAGEQVLARECANIVIKSAAKFLETKPSLHAADGKVRT